MKAAALALACFAVGVAVGRLSQPISVNMPLQVAPPNVTLKLPDTFRLFGALVPAPAEPAVVAGPLRDRLGFHGLRARLAAELDRRANLPEGDPLRISPEQREKGQELVGKLGDGHLLELLLKYGPSIIKLVEMILALIAVL